MSTTSEFPAPLQQARWQPETSDATRYLSAAAYLDEGFARAVVDEVIHQPHRAVALSHGISLGPIIRHSLAAQRKRLTRDCIIAAVLVLGFVISFTGGLAVTLSLLTLQLSWRGLGLIRARQIRSGLAYLLLAFLLPILVGAVLLSFSSLFMQWLYELSPFGLPFDYDSYDADAVSTRWAFWLVVLAVIWVTSFTYRLSVHRTIAVEFAPGSYDPRRAPAVDRAHQARLDYIEQAQAGNVTVYSEGKNSRPFIGFGDVIDEWVLVTPLQPAGATRSMFDTEMGETATSLASKATPFTVDELYDAIRTGLAELADPRLPPDEVVPHLSVRDRVFVAGRLPVNSSFLDHGRPRYRLGEAEVKQVQRAERGRTRHYQSVRMAAWGGEVEATTFLHVAVRGRMLFVEFVATVMPGIRPEYHEIDTYERLDAWSILRAAGRSFGDVIRSLSAFVTLAAAVVARLRRALSESADSQRIHRQLMFDYGCRSSVRELGANFDRIQRFQLYDASERINVVKHRVLPVLVRFLEEHHYAVSDLVGQVTTVINNSTRINNTNTITNSTVSSSTVAAGNAANINSAPTAASPAPSGGPSSGGRQ